MKLTAQFCLLVLLFFLSSCEKLFTLEGTIYLKEGERIARLSGTEIYLLDNRIDKIVLKNLDEYDSQYKAAIGEYQKKLLQEEIKKNEEILRDTVSQIQKNKLSLKDAKKLFKENAKDLSENEKLTTKSELSTQKKNVRFKKKILDTKKELKALDTLIILKKKKLSSILVEKRKESKKLIKDYKMRKNKIRISLKNNMKDLRRKINEIRSEISRLKTRITSQRRHLTLKLLKDYVQNKIVIVNNLKKRCRSCSQELTFFIENNGNKAIRAINFDLHYKNISLKNQGFKISYFGAYGLDRTWFPEKKNKYREIMYGIAPKERVLGKKSFYLRRRRQLQGNAMRFFEKMGGYDPSKFKVVISKVFLSDPSTYHSYDPYGRRRNYRHTLKRWKYKKQKLTEVFKKEINNSRVVKNAISSVKKVLAKQINLTKEIIKKKKNYALQKKKLLSYFSPLSKEKKKEILKAEKDLMKFKLTKKQKEKFKNLRERVAKFKVSIVSLKFKLQEMKRSVKSLKKKNMLFKEFKDVARRSLDSSMSKKKKLEFKIANLKDKKGPIFLEIKKFALKNVPLLEIQSLWLNTLIEGMKIAKLHSKNSDVDGNFKFEKLTGQATHIFSIANHSKKRFLWLVKLDLKSKNQQDLSDINNTVIDVNNINKLFEYFNKTISVKSGDVPIKGIAPMKN